MRSIHGSTRRAIAAAILLVLIGCRDEQPEWLAAGPVEQGATLTVEASSHDAEIGEQVTVAVRQGARLAELEGTLTFDPERLAYEGPDTSGGGGKNRVAIGGRRRLARVTGAPLPYDAAVLRFRVRAPNYMQGVSFHLDRATASGTVAPAQAAVRLHRGSASSQP